ncbi:MULTISPECIES: restriction endonuclease subunit S [Legionella]|uniref:restriction endonuclease subunit S n=1 Tax=Legionella TaxID=445 RepID=UPI000F8E40AA|nr:MULTISPECIES: restriction endonuclease subunit S [Legionella]MCP0914254.1 restriction endonuclease subunit S [Legionella sp. 27cVA30]RUR00591.1 restriction endonuclease subunit S [Legionella septentrionalis]
MSIMISHVPETWKLEKLGQLFEERKEKVSDKDFAPLSVTKQGVVPQMEHVAKSDDSDNRKRVAEGDFVINSRSDRRGSSGLSNLNGSVSLINIVLTPRHGYPRFLHYLMRSYAFQEEFYRVGHGIVADLWTTRYSELKGITVALPSEQTQKEIADFLDRETDRIDQLIEKKQKLIVVLQEKQGAELDHLTFSNPSKNEWKRIPFRWVCRIPNGQVDPREQPWLEMPLIAPNHIESNTGRITHIETAKEQYAISGKYTFPKGTVLYSKIRPALAKACIAPRSGLCSADMYPLIPAKNLIPEYLLMQILSRTFTDWASIESMRVAMPKINRETLGGFKLLIPPLTTQNKLASIWTIKTQKIDTLIQKIKDSIGQLINYRTSIITESVTGQLDIKSWKKRGSTDKHLDNIEEAMRYDGYK